MQQYTLSKSQTQQMKGLGRSRWAEGWRVEGGGFRVLGIEIQVHVAPLTDNALYWYTIL